jgi:predicted kinase
MPAKGRRAGAITIAPALLSRRWRLWWRHVLLRCHEYPDRRLAAVPGCGDRGLIACPGRGRARTYRRISVRKTTRARELAATHPAVRLTPDHWQIALFGNSIGDFQRPGGERWVLEGRLISVALQALRLGTSVVLDFGLWGRDERWALRWLARAAGAACQVVYLPVDKDVHLARIAHRQETTPHQTFPMSEADVDAWREQFQEPDAAELDGGEIPDPPAGWPGWAEWAREQWPTCTDS